MVGTLNVDVEWHCLWTLTAPYGHGQWVCSWPPPRDPSGKAWVVLLGSVPCQGLRDSCSEVGESLRTRTEGTDERGGNTATNVVRTPPWSMCNSQQGCSKVGSLVHEAKTPIGLEGQDLRESTACANLSREAQSASCKIGNARV